MTCIYFIPSFLTLHIHCTCPKQSDSMIAFTNMYLARPLIISVCIRQKKRKLYVSVNRKLQEVNTMSFSKDINFITKKVLFLFISFSNIYLKERKNLTFIEHLLCSKHCDKHFPNIISFVFSHQLCEEVSLHRSLENPEIEFIKPVVNIFLGKKANVTNGQVMSHPILPTQKNESKINKAHLKAITIKFTLKLKVSFILCILIEPA